MRKYWYIFRIELARHMEFRFNFWMGRCILLLVWLMNYYVLTSIFASHASIVGYSLSQIVTYALGASLFYNVVIVHEQERIGWDIVEGTLNTYLVKPVSYFWQYVVRAMTDRLITTASAVILLGSVAFLTYSPLIPDISVIGRGILALSVATIIFLFIDFLMGISSFWLDRSFGPRWMFMTLIVMTSGSIFPIDLLPSWITTPLFWTPFPYLIFFPLNVFLGRVDSTHFLQGISIAIGWAIILFFLVRLAWHRGLKRYEGVGI